MQTIIDYAEHELRTFIDLPLNPVDALILSELSYLCIGEAFSETVRPDSEVTLRDLFAREQFPTLFQTLLSTENPARLIAAAASSPRFRDVRVTRYVNTIDHDSETQFSALTYLIPGGSSFIAYRGTDSSLVGWKENFNMAFMAPVPAQTSAVDYLERALPELSGPIYLGGHSKGGNLAVYAASACSPASQDRIMQVYNQDGPGFNEQLLDSPGFARVRGRLNKTVPQDSIIGMLLETHEDYSVVQSDGRGLLQHDPFTWSVEVDNCDFHYLERITQGADRTDRALNEWISSLSTAQREAFVDALYGIIQSSGYERLSDLSKISTQELIKQLADLQANDIETYTIVRDTLAALVGYSMRANLPNADNLPQPFKFLFERYTERRLFSGIQTSLRSSQGPASDGKPANKTGWVTMPRRGQQNMQGKEPAGKGTPAKGDDGKPAGKGGAGTRKTVRGDGAR
jgi:hypothetical protein